MRKTFLMKATICIAALLMSIASYAQLRLLAGKVVDPNGEPIVGASVVVPGQSSIRSRSTCSNSIPGMLRKAKASSRTLAGINPVIC